ncbi:WxL domain-containing protein [Vagococcus vulneris]|nr:WxL domain-containing protein [Vagococcus vulneris]
MIKGFKSMFSGICLVILSFVILTGSVVAEENNPSGVQSADGDINQGMEATVNMTNTDEAIVPPEDTEKPGVIPVKKEDNIKSGSVTIGGVSPLYFKTVQLSRYGINYETYAQYLKSIGTSGYAGISGKNIEKDMDVYSPGFTVIDTRGMGQNDWSVSVSLTDITDVSDKTEKLEGAYLQFEKANVSIPQDGDAQPTNMPVSQEVAAVIPEEGPSQKLISTSNTDDGVFYIKYPPEQIKESQIDMSEGRTLVKKPAKIKLILTQKPKVGKYQGTLTYNLNNTP